MKKLCDQILFTCVYLAVYLASRLPMRVLYTFSTSGYLLLFYIFSYRKSVVIQNVSRSFPEENYKQIQVIVKHFYQSFTDYFVEILKTLSMSPANFGKKIEFVHTDILNSYLDAGKNVIVTLGHCGNWEVLNLLPQKLTYDSFAVYKPLRNKALDRLMQTFRSRFGMMLVPSKSIARHILSRKDNPALYLFLADQCPKVVDEKYRFIFLNQPTSMFPGAEKLARSTNSAVVYLHITQTSRGHYRLEFIPICAEAQQTEESFITQKYTHLLEQNIIQQPHSWLWSHKRWKR